MDPASGDEVMRRVNEGFIPIIKDADGFLAYYALEAGAGEIATVSVFEDQAGAEFSGIDRGGTRALARWGKLERGVKESVRIAADWVRQNLAALLPDPPEIIAGEVEAHELNLTKLGVRKVRE
jgi:hypothetical protein